jgi:hypothetical protein
VSWQSKKQRSVALSSTEAEYVALSFATQEAIWLKAFKFELGEHSEKDAIVVLEDNQGAIALAKNPEFHKRTKHIDIRYHFVRENVETGNIGAGIPTSSGQQLELVYKSEVADKFVHFLNWAETQTGRRVKVLRCDNGGQYKSSKMSKICHDRGIVQQFTPPYTPQLNGVAERMNRTLVECARCMLEHAKLPKPYWGEAVMTAGFLQNRLPSRTNSRNGTPIEVWSGKVPKLDNLKVFGCHAFVHVPSAKRLKLDPRASRCRFIGYTLSMRMRIVSKRSILVVFVCSRRSASCLPWLPGTICFCTRWTSRPRS